MTDLREQLRVYFDEVDPPFDPAGLMREPRPELTPTRRRVGRGVLVAGAAAAVLVLVLALPLLLLAIQSETAGEPSATTTEAPTTTTEPATTTTVATTTAPDQAISRTPEAPADVFSWSEGDISDWVTEDEMEAVLADLSIEYAGTRLNDEAEFERSGDSYELALTEGVWTVGPIDGLNRWEVRVHNGDHNADDLWLHETDLELPKGEITTGGWDVFTARGPNSDESFCIGLVPPKEVFGPYVQEDIYVEMVSAVASMMLEELRWVD